MINKRATQVRVVYKYLIVSSHNITADQVLNIAHPCSFFLSVFRLQFDCSLILYFLATFVQGTLSFCFVFLNQHRSVFVIVLASISKFFYNLSCNITNASIYVDFL